MLDVELAAILRALQRHYHTDQKKHAKVTFIVIQKRHHTRFFPTGPKSSDGTENNNIPAGTVVDKDIVHPFQYQFFMASHAAIQGVTKPAKYCVLVNESKIPPDDLQAITYGKNLWCRLLFIHLSEIIFLFQTCAICSHAAIARCLIPHRPTTLISSQLAGKFTPLVSESTSWTCSVNSPTNGLHQTLFNDARCSSFRHLFWGYSKDFFVTESFYFWSECRKKRYLQAKSKQVLLKRIYFAPIYVKSL